jgi:tryptophan synthase alpha chain
MGIDRFLRRAARSGVSGILVPDLPPEDAGEFRQAALALGLAPIPLAAPNSRAERYQVMTQGAAGFLYQITRTGTTGAKTGKLPAYLGKQVRLAREISGLPVCLGFGISTPEQVREAWSMAEGAVVGSALLQALASEKSAAAQARRAGEFVSWLAQAREEV